MLVQELLTAVPDLTIKNVMGLTAYDYLCQDLTVRADMCVAFKLFAGGAIFTDIPKYTTNILQCVEVGLHKTHGQMLKADRAHTCTSTVMVDSLLC